MTLKQKRALADAEAAVAVDLAELERLISADVHRIMAAVATLPPDVDWTPLPADGVRLAEAITVPGPGDAAS